MVSVKRLKTLLGVSLVCCGLSSKLVSAELKAVAYKEDRYIISDEAPIVASDDGQVSTTLPEALRNNSYRFYASTNGNEQEPLSYYRTSADGQYELINNVLSVHHLDPIRFPKFNTFSFVRLNERWYLLDFVDTSVEGFAALIVRKEVTTTVPFFVEVLKQTRKMKGDVFLEFRANSSFNPTGKRKLVAERCEGVEYCSPVDYLYKRVPYTLNFVLRSKGTLDSTFGVLPAAVQGIGYGRYVFTDSEPRLYYESDGSLIDTLFYDSPNKKGDQGVFAMLVHGIRWYYIKYDQEVAANYYGVELLECNPDEVDPKFRLSVDIHRKSPEHKMDPFVVELRQSSSEQLLMASLREACGLPVQLDEHEVAGVFFDNKVPRVYNKMHAVVERAEERHRNPINGPTSHRINKTFVQRHNGLSLSLYGTLFNMSVREYNDGPQAPLPDILRHRVHRYYASADMSQAPLNYYRTYAGGAYKQIATVLMQSTNVDANTDPAQVKVVSVFVHPKKTHRCLIGDRLESIGGFSPVTLQNASKAMKQVCSENYERLLKNIDALTVIEYRLNKATDVKAIEKLTVLKRGSSAYLNFEMVSFPEQVNNVARGRDVDDALFGTLPAAVQSAGYALYVFTDTEPRLYFESDGSMVNIDQHYGGQGGADGAVLSIYGRGRDWWLVEYGEDLGRGFFGANLHKCDFDSIPAEVRGYSTNVHAQVVEVRKKMDDEAFFDSLNYTRDACGLKMLDKIADLQPIEQTYKIAVTAPSKYSQKTTRRVALNPRKLRRTATTKSTATGNSTVSMDRVVVRHDTSKGSTAIKGVAASASGVASPQGGGTATTTWRAASATSSAAAAVAPTPVLRRKLRPARSSTTAAVRSKPKRSDKSLMTELIYEGQKILMKTNFDTLITGDDFPAALCLNSNRLYASDDITQAPLSYYRTLPDRKYKKLSTILLQSKNITPETDPSLIQFMAVVDSHIGNTEHQYYPHDVVEMSESVLGYHPLTLIRKNFHTWFAKFDVDVIEYRFLKEDKIPVQYESCDKIKFKGRPEDSIRVFDFMRRVYKTNTSVIMRRGPNVDDATFGTLPAAVQNAAGYEQYVFTNSEPRLYFDNSGAMLKDEFYTSRSVQYGAEVVVFALLNRGGKLYYIQLEGDDDVVPGYYGASLKQCDAAAFEMWARSTVLHRDSSLLKRSPYSNEATVIEVRGEPSDASFWRDYMTARKACGLSAVDNFDELSFQEKGTLAPFSCLKPLTSISKFPQNVGYTSVAPTQPASTTVRYSTLPTRTFVVEEYTVHGISTYYSDKAPKVTGSPLPAQLSQNDYRLYAGDIKKSGTGPTTFYVTLTDGKYKIMNTAHFFEGGYLSVNELHDYGALKLFDQWYVLAKAGPSAVEGFVPLRLVPMPSRLKHMLESNANMAGVTAANLQNYRLPTGTHTGTDSVLQVSGWLDIGDDQTSCPLFYSRLWCDVDELLYSHNPWALQTVARGKTVEDASFGTLPVSVQSAGYDYYVFTDTKPRLYFGSDGNLINTLSVGALKEKGWSNVAVYAILVQGSKWYYLEYIKEVATNYYGVELHLCNRDAMPYNVYDLIRLHTSRNAVTAVYDSVTEFRQRRNDADDQTYNQTRQACGLDSAPAATDDSPEKATTPPTFVPYHIEKLSSKDD